MRERERKGIMGEGRWEERGLHSVSFITPKNPD